MNQLFCIAAGAGALMRYYLSDAIQIMLGRGFPYGTLTVNIIGSLFMGLIVCTDDRTTRHRCSLAGRLDAGIIGRIHDFFHFLHGNIKPV